jgi:hypothetical protein
MLAFVLVSFGLTNILVYSRLIPRPQSGWLSKFMHCPMCVGFHVGWILMLVPNTLFEFDVSVGNGFMLGCIASGTSYFLSMVVSDDGIRIN